MATTEQPVLYQQDGPIVTVTLNRPEVMNNFGGGLFQALGEAANRFQEDDSARVMILTGRGRAFCAGADLKAIEQRLREATPVLAARTPEAQRRSFFANRKFTRLTDIYKPIIGAINGYCFAGGLEVALACHFRIGAESSEYGVLNRRWAVPLVDGGTYRLPLIVGLGNALYLIQTGARINAHEALRIGLIQELVPDERLLDRARELATIMATVPQSGLVADTEAVLRGLGRPYEEALAQEAVIGSTVAISGEALGRFVAKQYDPRTGAAPAGEA
ncbi:MAG TPA: enoyl-CoA hydratase-related protein [Dehalococcoidia bacterium]|jgi:enoyl-CoA hydratase|nr:enoyl-CoA hydratase-related protein [Dehalococcoidia bacterium]